MIAEEIVTPESISVQEFDLLEGFFAVAFLVNESPKYRNVSFATVKAWFEEKNALYLSYLRSRDYEEHGGEWNDVILMEELVRMPALQKRFLADYCQQNEYCNG